MNRVRITLLLIKRTVEWLAVTLFVWITIVSFLQLIFRWFGISGLGWVDQQVRILVLWIALIGGILAAANGRHIQINVFDNILNKKYVAYLHRFINVVAFVLTISLLKISLPFIYSERMSGTNVDGFLFGMTIPIWWIESLIPVSFFLMSLFFLGRSILPVETERSGGER